MFVVKGCIADLPINFETLKLSQPWWILIPKIKINSSISQIIIINRIIL